MPICSYVVIPRSGATDAVQSALSEVPGCDVVRARNRELLLLVTDTPGLGEEAELRASIEAMEGIQALLLTFGEIDPDADIPDPVALVGDRRAP